MAPPAVIGHFEKVTALACDGGVVALGGTRASAASRVTLYDLHAGKTLGGVDVPCHVRGLARAGSLLLAACDDGRLRAWHVASDGALTAALELDAHASPCAAVAVAPGGERVFTVGHDGALRQWSVAARAMTRAWPLSTSPLRAVAVDPTGEYVAAAGDDGVVRVITLATDARREMPGHEGAVHALAFTPRDGRLASAGDDAVVRIWYLVGAVEFEARGNDDAAHKGPVYALAFTPTPATPADGSDPGDRMVTAGADGKVKVWRLDERRKPRTLDAGGVALRALAFAAPAPNARNVLGAIVAAGDARIASRFSVDANGVAADTRTVLGGGFEAIAKDLEGQRPAREAAVKLLASLDEPEAAVALCVVMAGDREVPVRVLAVAEAGRAQRHGARAKLRELLDDPQAPVRAAALASLRQLDGERALAPLRAALASRHADLRAAAARALVPLREASPLVPGLVAGALTDADADVRAAALEAYVGLFPEGSAEPLRAAYERGPADVKADVIVRAAMLGAQRDPTLAPVLSRALDDVDPTVRRYAFAARVMERAALLATLEPHDEALRRTVAELARRAASHWRAAGATGAVTDAELLAARARMPSTATDGPLTDDDLAPVHTAMACHTADTALRGARALSLLGDTRALGALLQLTREADPALRREAAASLEALDDPRARRRLVWMLDDVDANVRAAALDALSKTKGAARLDVAEAALRASHEDIRVRGLDALVKLGEGEATEALLGDAVEDEAAKVRGEAFKTLWAWHAKQPARALDRALAARFPDLRLRAVQELSALGADGWARERLRAAIGDRDAAVATAALEAVRKLEGDADPTGWLAAMGSLDASVRAAGARGAVKAPVGAVREALTRLLGDDAAAPRTAALEALDALLPDDNGPHHAALQGAHLDLRVRAAELLAHRHDERLVDPMRALLADKDLPRQLGAPLAAQLRQRAAAALATLGAARLTRYFATELLKDDDALVREHAARGLATAARAGDEPFLLDALGHADVWVRSWAADGLSRLGDARALPVLTGNLRNDHLPIRLGAILSFAALGPDGWGGVIQGLDDGSREVQEMVLAVVLARDLRALRRGEAPELLTSALSSQRLEVRFAAARALELRGDPETFLAFLVEVLTPPRPDAKAMERWPSEERRGRALVRLAGALASDHPSQRYAAAQALVLRKRPLEFFREAERAGALRPATAPWVPDTAPRPVEEGDAKPPAGWLRRLFAGDANDAPELRAAREEVPDAERQQLRRLAFGAYVGMLRQGSAGDDEGHRVRRDAIDRIVELGLSPDVGAASAVPCLARALDDGNHLVRKAAFAGLRRLFPEGSDEALSLALAAGSADVARAALDELASRGASAWPRIARALDARDADVRRYAFELLERLSPRGSLDPLLAALRSEHADLRLGVLERVASSQDARVVEALGRALESEHDDLRLRAAELLCQRRDDRPVDVLAAFLRGDDKAAAVRAQSALVALASTAAVRCLSARADELAGAERAALLRAMGATRNPEAVALLVGRFDDDDAAVRNAALDACWEVSGRAAKTRDHALVLRFVRAAVRARDASLRAAAAGALDVGDDPSIDGTLTALFADRDALVRAAAVHAYSRRVIDKSAAVEPLDAVLREGRRELVLSAAEGVAHRGLASALRPLLLVVRAGEAGERERALLALGTLGDARALEELESVAAGGTAEEPVEPDMQAAAVEALGRIAPKLADADARARVLERVEVLASESPLAHLRHAALRGVRAAGGERARALLEAVLLDETVHGEARAVAAKELGAAGDAGAEEALARALHTHDVTARTAARAALDALFPSDPTRVALRAVDSPHADIAGPAASYLATAGDPTTLVPRLASVRAPALRARLRYGLLRRGAAPVEALSALLEHASPEVRAEAAWLAGALTGAGEGEATYTTLDGASRAALRSALASAVTRSPSRWSAAAPAQRAAEAAAWSRALWAAARHGATELAATARGLAAAGEAVPVEVRREAARALIVLGDAGGATSLTAALGDADAGVRGAAARALVAVAGDAATAAASAARPFDPVRFGAAVTATTRGALLASEAGRRLALPGALVAKDATALVAMAREAAGDTATRLDAVAALGRMGGPEATAALAALAFDKAAGDVAFRKAAYRALRRARRGDARAEREATR